MKETYGVVGTGSAPKKVIESALNDIGSSSTFLVPWYGKVTTGLEVVYDWLLDNEATFTIVATEGSKAVPKALALKATEIHQVEDVVDYILWDLKGRPVPGLTLVMWDTENEEESIRVSSMSIDLKLSTLELTNGLVPIIIDGDEELEPIRDDELPDFGETNYSKETLEVMPSALVKRMAKDKGTVVKTKEEGIAFLTKPSDELKHEIGSIVILMKNGDEIGFTLTQELFKEVMAVVTAHQRPW